MSASSPSMPSSSHPMAPSRPPMNASWRASVLGSQLAELLRRPGRLVTTGLSVLVASFVVFATVMAQQITTNTTLDRFRGTPESVSLVATASDESATHISDAALQRIRALPGVAEAVGRVDTGAPVAGPSQRWLDLDADPGTGPLSRVELVEGSYPEGPGRIAVNRQAAEELRISPGARIGLLRPDPENPEKTVEIPVTVTGVVRSTATAERQPTGYAMDTDLSPFAEVPGYRSVDIRAEKDASEAELSRQIRDVLDADALAAADTPDAGSPNANGSEADATDADGSEAGATDADATDAGVFDEHASGKDALDTADTTDTGAEAAEADHASTPASVTSGSAVRAREAREAVAQFSEVFQLIAVFLAVAVGAAALVATSAFRIVFAQRLRQLALLRAIGAPQRRLVTALAVEGALVGVVAGSLGVLSALGAGHLAPPAVRLLTGQELSAPGVPVLYAVLVVAGTVLVTVGAVLAPALSAARVSPLQALRASGDGTGERRVRSTRLGVGLLLAAGAAGLAALLLGQLPQPGQEDYDRDFALMATVASAALAFLALIALGPLLVRPVLTVAGWPLRRLGTTGRLAVSGVGGTPRRAAAVSVVVALGVALVSGALVCLACLNGQSEHQLAVEAPADFQVTAADKGLDPAVVRQFAASPELAHVTGYRTLPITLGPDQTRREFEVSDLDPGALSTGGLIDTATGSLDDLGPGHAVVAADVADLLGLRAGDTLTLPARRGDIELTVAATLPGRGPAFADVLVVPADLDRMGAPENPTGVLADAADEGTAARGEAHRELEATLREHAPDLGSDDVDISVPADGRDDSQESVRMMGTTALGLVALTVLIAVVGVTATTSLTAIERTREFGLLRALGLGGGALRRTITMEAGLYGALGGLLGLALGIPYAWLLIRIAVTDAPLRLPGGQLLLVFTGLALLTALAGLLPARHATRVTPMTALGDTE